MSPFMQLHGVTLRSASHHQQGRPCLAGVGGERSPIEVVVSDSDDGCSGAASRSSSTLSEGSRPVLLSPASDFPTRCAPGACGAQLLRIATARHGFL